jgi:hypothetical protein
VWFGLNPTAAQNGRGEADQVTRLVGLPIDLDIKPGACVDLAHAERIIDAASALIGQRPVLVIFSGHGLQAIWLIEEGDICAGFPQANAEMLLGQWHRLVDIVSDEHGAKLDNVYDLPRVLRMTETVNFKEVEPAPTGGRIDTGGPMTPLEAGERMAELGIEPQPKDTHDVDMISDPTGWKFGTTTPYVLSIINGLSTDGPRNGARNPWGAKQAVRLCCAWRTGAISELTSAAV